MSPADVVIVGGGFSGLASAALLARDGYDVQVLEQRDGLGGRAGTWAQDGFRFDTGPSWYLMPEGFDHFFRLLGTTAEAELDLEVLEPGYRVYFEGEGRPVDVHADQAANLATFEAIEPGAGARLERYLASARDVYDVATRRFLYTSFESLAPMLRRDVLVRSRRLLRLFGGPLEGFVARSFADPRLRQVLGYAAVFLGSSPDRAPSRYHMMSHLDLADGVRYPQGGFVRVVDAIAALAEKEGARLRTGATVTAITTTRPRRGRPRVTGVRYREDGRERTAPADVVVGAADLHHVETALLPPELQTYPQRWWDRRESGPGAVLVYLGVRGGLPQLAHHSLFFTRDWPANFDAVLGTDGPSDPRVLRVPDPASLYVSRTSATDGPSSSAPAAPPGHENLFVLVPFPADPTLGADAESQRLLEALADRYLAQVGRWAGVPDLPGRVVTRRVLGPAHFATELSSWRGSALGMEHTLRQSALWRPGNASRRVDGLYHAGGGTIPGVGLPMCLISAELVAKRLRGDRSSSPLPESERVVGARE